MKTLIAKLSFRIFLLAIICFSFTNNTSAQHLMLGNDQVQVEVGLNFGPTFFLGDLGGKVGKGTRFVKDLNYEFTKMMKGVFVTVYPSSWYGVRLAGQYTYLEGDDAVISTHGVDELWRKQRNLDFKSDVWEAYGALEVYPLDYLNRNNEDGGGRFRPYLFGGLGVYHFNPKGSLTDANGNVTWHELQPLRTEGQGFAEYPDRQPYKLTQMNIPMGFGFKYEFSENMNAGLEFLYRKTLTDYIDDVSKEYIDHNLFYANLPASDANIADRISDKTIGIVTPGVGRYAPGVQRGNPKQDDAYFSFLFKLGFRIGGGNGYNSGGNGSSYNRNVSKRLGCPIRF